MRSGFTVVLMAVVPVLGATPAAANVSSSTSLTVPVAVAVGESGVPGSLTTVNTNTPPNTAESNTLTSIRLALGCAAAPAPPNPCPTPDVGVATVASPASGGTGTRCAGVTFTVSAPDASGIVTFTPSVSVVLEPPGGSPGSDRCTVNFTFSVLKVPTTDVDLGVGGTQTFVNARVVAQSPGGLMPANHPSVKITVNRALPGLTTQASPSVAVGGSLSDTATLTGVAGIAAPTGTVTFNLYGPNDASCAGTPAASSTNAISGGSAQSNLFPLSQAGTYRFVATYNGDALYGPRTTACGDATRQSS